ncbi:Fur family transcriptional regulator [Anaerosacchariphilus polymeriproducens]|uniref:Transcriptional repressor n=1 Tax=Anaerosacchariphilus polymeriproducens TaxID=1812858 RepID=A0A371AV98_9FIRM|nr:Fur family transcriptional regulator [Anaerosacchariphilus polymeriproducens]RDU23505.1 transcriptional repressor [Anaerosacchariphilus polymeriproducens]
MQVKNDYEKSLRENGLKSTKNRKAIIDVLVKNEQPMTAEEIYNRIKGKKIALNISTVYRTLDTLYEKGMVNKLNFLNNDRMLFEYNSMEHKHYLICLDCKKIITIKKCPLAPYEKFLENETNFKIEGHRLYLYGHCMQCQINKK